MFYQLEVVIFFYFCFMQFPNSYLTVKEEKEALFKDRGSKHIGIVRPIDTEEEFNDWILELKKKHPTSNHVCFAYRLGFNGEKWRINDDGEPSGSAGQPILGQIDSFEVTQVGAAVIRYFGGTKLGVGGLINAYRNAVKSAFEKCTIIEVEVMHQYIVKVDYDFLSGLKQLIRQSNLKIISEDYGIQCTFVLGQPAGEDKIDTSEFLAPLQNGEMKFVKTK